MALIISRLQVALAAMKLDACNKPVDNGVEYDIRRAAVSGGFYTRSSQSIRALLRRFSDALS
jgi:hypothetical protein